MEFITVEEFRARTGVTAIKAVRSPKTGKMFLDTDKGIFRMEQKFDPSLPHKFMIGDGEKIEDSCLVNVKNEDNTVFTL